MSESQKIPLSLREALASRQSTVLGYPKLLIASLTLAMTTGKLIENPALCHCEATAEAINRMGRPESLIASLCSQ